MPEKKQEFSKIQKVEVGILKFLKNAVPNTVQPIGNVIAITAFPLDPKFQKEGDKPKCYPKFIVNGKDVWISSEEKRQKLVKMLQDDITILTISRCEEYNQSITKKTKIKVLPTIEI